MQVEAIQTVLAGMKNRLLNVQQQVAEQLREYEHLTKGPAQPPEATLDNDEDRMGSSEGSTLYESGGGQGSMPHMMDVVTGVQKKTYLDTLDEEIAPVQAESGSAAVDAQSP